MPNYSKTLPGGAQIINGRSPIDLVVTDPDGLTINKQVNEIPDAFYMEQDQDRDGSPDDSIWIPERKLGEYNIEVIPEPGASPTDTYTVEVCPLEDGFGYLPIVLAEDVPIGEVPSEPYIYLCRNRELSRLTYTGDLSCKYSETVELSAMLTDDYGYPISGKTIRFRIGNQTASAQTNPEGIATTSLNLQQFPSEYYEVEADYYGCEYYLPSTDSCLFAILITPIEVDAGPDQIVNEGDILSISGTFTNPNSVETLIAIIDWGDGTVDHANTTMAGDTGIVTASHAYGDDAINTAVLLVADRYGGLGKDSITVTTNNVAPTVEAGLNIVIQYSDFAEFKGSFTDPGSLDTHTSLWDFGDGSTDPGTLIEENEAPDATGNLTAQHRYIIEPGTCIVTMVVTDDDGAAGESSLTLTVEKEDPVLSTPAGEIVYSDNAVIQINMLDDDGENMYHQADYPKVVYLECFNNSDWSVIAQDELASRDDSDSILDFYFEIPSDLDEPAGDYPLRARFDGDTYYNSAVSETGTLTVIEEAVVTTVADTEGFYDDTVTLEAVVLDDDGEPLLHGPFPVEFEVGDSVIGSADVAEDGSVSIDWKVDIIPIELIEAHPITVTFAVNDYYESSQGEGEFTLKSAQWLKQEAISELEAARTSDKKVDKEIDRVIADIEDSLADNNGSLWIDASHLVTDEEVKDGFRGLKVFHEEKKAVTSGVKLPPEVDAVVTEVIDKLVKADQLLAKVAIHDAVNTPAENPNSQSKVDHHLTKAGEYIASSYVEMANDRPDKAIKSLEQCWHHTQLAIKAAQS